MMQEKNNELNRAVQLLQAGKLVAIPTETVYGLAANAFDDKAVQSIFLTKGRPSNNPLIVHIKSVEDLLNIAKDVPNLAWKLAHHFWPGPLTLILNKRPEISNFVTGGNDTVAVRVPNHTMTLNLLKRLDFPLVAPSANRSNHISPTQPDHVMNSLGEHCPFILDGGVCQKGLESTIVGFEDDEVVLLRHGAIAQEQLEDFLGKTVKCKIQYTQQVLSPGSSKKHYSPKTPLIALNNIEDKEVRFSGKIGFLMLKKNEFHSEDLVLELSSTGSLEEAAANLYKTLHEMDQMNLDLIVAVLVPNSGLGVSINDRLIRAASQ